MERAQRLLMVGSDYQAVEATRDLDLEITLLYGGATRDWGLPVPPGVRAVFVDDQKSIDSALIGLYRAGIDPAAFDAVYAHDDMSLMTASALGRMFGVRHIPPQVVALFRDKDLQKSRIRQAGLPVTEHLVIEDIRQVPDDFELPFTPAVVKPVAGMATQSTHVVRDLADLRRVSRQCREQGVSARTFIVEAFVDGEEWFVDGAVSGGEVRFAALGRYAQPCLSAITEQAPVRTYSVDPADEAYELALPLVSEALAVLGLTDGVFHMELFHHAGTNTLTFSECAARRGGGPLADQVRYKFGVDLASYSVRCALGKVSEIPTEVRPGVVASSFLPLVPGYVLGYPSAAEIVALDDVVHTRVYLPLGARVAAAGTNTFRRLGEVTVHCDTVEQATRRLDEVVDWFVQRMEALPLAPTFHELWPTERNAGFQDVAGA